jgi:hypothetical protein
MVAVLINTTDHAANDTGKTSPYTTPPEKGKKKRKKKFR